MAGSLDAPLPALDPLAGWSAEELGLEDDGEEGEDGAGVDGAGVAGEVVLRLGLIEPDGEEGDVVLPLPDVVRSAPRSHAAIRLAPKARDTATARV